MARPLRRALVLARARRRRRRGAARPPPHHPLAPGTLELLDALREGDEAAVAHAVRAGRRARNGRRAGTLSGLEEDAAAREPSTCRARAVRLGGERDALRRPPCCRSSAPPSRTPC
ncbi:MAG: hypothetical protein ACLR3C_15875 [Eggerthella lenta]